MIGRNSIVNNRKIFSKRKVKIAPKNFLPLSINRQKKKNYRLLIGRKLYDVRDHVCSKFFIGFKLEIGCTVQK